MPTKKITKPEGGDLATYEPSEARIAAYKDLSPESFKWPVIHLYKGTEDEDDRLGAGFTKGEWVNTLTGEVLTGKHIVPIVSRENTIAFWKRKKDGNNTGNEGRAWKGPRGQCPVEIQADENINVTNGMDWYVLVEDEVRPHVIYCRVSSMDSGKLLNTLEQDRMMMKRPPGAYVLASRTKKFSGGTTHVPVFQPSGDATDEEQLAVESNSAFLRDNPVEHVGSMADTE